LWTHEHGPQGGDEINRPQAGQNHGWPVVSFGKHYGGFTIGDGITEKAGMQAPLHHWTPSIAPSGMAFVTSQRYGPGWHGNLVVGSLKLTHLARLELDGTRVVREHKLLAELCQAAGAKVILCNHWAEGSKGTEELAKEVVQMCERPNTFKVLYDDKATLWDKVNTIAKEIYRAENVTADAAVRKQFDEYQERYGHFPVCMAKTQSSFSTDPTKMGAPVNHTVHVRELRLSAGAEFVVAVCGEIMIMPGLPKIPSAERIYVKEDGQIEGLF
jgi:formate--tetrahydrofolate ligase